MDSLLVSILTSVFGLTLGATSVMLYHYTKGINSNKKLKV